MAGRKTFALMLLTSGGLFFVGVGFGKFWPLGDESPEVGRVPEPVRVPLGNSVGTEELPEVFGRLAGAGNAELVAALELGLDGGFDGEQDLMALALRWVLEDAEGGAGFLLEMIGEDEHEGAERYYGIFEAFWFAWGKQDARGMGDYVARMVAEGHPLSEDLEEIAAEMGAGNVEMALEFFDSLEGGVSDTDSEMAHEMLGLLAKSDPQKAIAYLARFSGHHRRNGIGRVAENWAEHDPVGAVEWAGKLAGPKERKGGLDSALRKIAERDLGMAMELFGRFRKELLDSATAKTIVFELGKEDPKRALLWFHEQSKDVEMLSHSVLSDHGILMKLLPRSAGETHAFLGKLPEGALKRSISHQLAYDESRIDRAGSPSEFLTGIAELPEDELRSKLLAGGLRGWAKQDLDGVAEAVTGLDGKLRAAAVREVFSTYKAFDSAVEAIEFASETNADIDALGDVQTGNMGDWEDIEKAADMFARASEPDGNTLVGEFVSAWARRSPAEALEWVGDRPGENPQLVGRVVEGWLAEDPAAASAWAADLEDPNARGAAASAVSKATRYQDPEASFAWALEVEDVMEREELIRGAYLFWRGRDKGAADEALMGNGVPRELREIFLEE